MFKNKNIINGMQGEQEGELDFFPDGKLIGKLTDKDDSLVGEKLVLGVYSDEGKRLNFIKVYPGLRRRSDIMPVMWDLRAPDPKKNLLYTGHFVFLGDDFPIIGEIGRRMHQGVELGDLTEINPDTLKEIYFNQRILEMAEAFARERNWCGELLLSKR